MHWIVIIITIFHVHLWEVESLLLNFQNSCTPSASVIGPCHECVCNSEGVFECRATTCQPKNVNPSKSGKYECQPHMVYRFDDIICTCNFEGKWMSHNCRETFQYLRPNGVKTKDTLRSNNSAKVYQVKHNELPQIQKGQSCVPGKLYKMSCNTCRCGDNGSLFCTKMACLEKMILKGDRDERKYEPLNIRTKRYYKSNKKSEKETVKKIKSNLPPLPEGECVPGKVYQKGCNKCFCNDQKMALCTRICKTTLSSRVNDDEIAQIETRSAIDIPQLPHMGAECEPGKVYRVSCNLCFCSEGHNLYCTMKYCLNVNNYAELQAKKLTGQACTEDYKELCSDCKCVNNKSECKAIEECNPSEIQTLSSTRAKIKLTLDVKKDTCEPFASYKVHCNECYCQSDGTLRCTQKVCLNYSQTKKLKERENYLEKHGL
ncbi:uncharacterized protein LOC124540195 [Vanessa cardui]|uniref:uncharacterized protein LOC124540195 n=1 Tax=Vanessa cardui TaxID=171605 RepID=UPI001F143C37|nr:uncharacterized protein LOC124540195 [Vanessa cardui]